ncbi:hypothetical protein V3851_03760 [Paenibacillus sp. M1]|uniref:Uncharacterized protein n=1 Tax=Paenibacillus haidiansis TaxID=1574488 RepID=A0ABU7VNW1_9BACL
MAAKKTPNPQETPETQNEVRFAKRQFLTSARFTGKQKDVLTIVLDESQRYTATEAERKMNEFITRSVN